MVTLTRIVVFLLVLVGVSACGTVRLKTTAADVPRYAIDKGPPHRFCYYLNGEERFCAEGPAAADDVEFRGEPGSCLRAGADRVYRPCEGDE